MAKIDKNQGRRSALSKRQKMIIQILAQMDSRPVTISAISEKLGVSSRTVLREVPAIEQWLTNNDFHFSRKPGVGLAITEDSENLKLIQELLDVEDIIPMYSRQERRRQILGELFFSVEPVKAFVFTSRYRISENTLYEDLDSLDLWLTDYNLSIVRKPGVGIFLPGSEIFLRQAISNAVFEFCDVNKIFGEQNPLLTFFQAPIVSFAERVLTENEKLLHVKYTDSGLISLIIRLSLAIYRMQNGKYITQPVQPPEYLTALTEYSSAKHIAEKIHQEFSLEVTEYEVGYIAMHLSSARIWSRASEVSDPRKALDIRQIVLSMTGIAERLTNLPFHSSSVLTDDLVNHISAMSKRLSMNLIEENSQTDAVRQNYPEIYSAVETSCQVLKEWLYPKELQEADIGFIAMHFAAAAERIQEHSQKVAVVVVCPTGIGSSKMLAASLARSFHNIDIRRVISAFAIDPDNLREEGIDLIISTMELHIDFPHICVGKVLQIQDKLMLQNEIEAINRKRLQQKTRRGRSTNVSLRLDNIQRITHVGMEVVELIQNFCIYQVNSVSDLQQMIEQAAGVFTKDDTGKEKIAAAFLRREQIEDTYIPEMNICLFHCKTDAVQHSRFGFLRLKKPLITPDKKIRGAVIMLAPDHYTDEIYLEPVGRLSALLIEEEDFLQALQSGSTTAGAALAEKALVKYYQNEITKQIGGVE